MFDFEALSQAIPNQTVLCVGDLMLDEFVYGEVSRISPEAPAPVIAVQRSETNVGGAGNVARNIASLGARCIFAGLVGEDEAGAKLKADLAREKLIEAVLVSDSSPPDDAQGALRLRAFFHPHAARGLGAGRSGLGRDRAKADRRDPAAARARRYRAAVRLCQGRADGARHPQRHRRRQEARQARDRRSQERQFRDLSRRHAADAQPQGICGSHPQPRRYRPEHCRRGAGRDGSRRLRGDAGDAERTRHDAGGSRRRGDPRAGAAGQGARRLRRGRHGRRRAGADAGGRGRLGDGAADGECGGRGCGRQEGHRDRDAGGAAAENPAACVAGGRREDRARRRRSRCASCGLAPAGAAHRLHQWLLRHPASRPRQGADGRARRLRPADRRSQQRCLGEAAEGRGTPGAG